MRISLSIDPYAETKKITTFLKSVQKKTGIKKVVIGLSGGIDSTTVLYLLKKVYKTENIIGVSLSSDKIKNIINAFRGSIPKFFDAVGTPTPQKRKKFDISPHSGDETKDFFHFREGPSLARRDSRVIKNTLSSLNQKVRLGNIMARIRMIILFDLAKKNNGLVCGTENKSERLLGYFTRFGDSASDIEPITHLYKSQVYQLAKYLKVPKKVINAVPTAGLWPGQTDEGEFNFSYEEADQVLHLFIDKKISQQKILKMGFKNTNKILKRYFENQFKQETPYSLLRK